MESHDSTAANEPQAVAQAEQPGDSVELNATNASATDVEKEATTDASATDVEKEANAANEDPATATESTAENNANEDSVDRNDLSDSAWTFGSPLASTAASPVGDASATASDLADDVPQPPSPTSVPATESEPGPPSPKSAGEALPVEPSAAHVDEPVHVEEEEQGEVPQSSESPVVPTQEDPSEGIDTQPPQTQGTPRKKYPYADVRNFISASMTAEDIATLKLWRLEKDEREKQWWKERKATLREAAKEDPECTFTPHITAHPQHENEDGNTPNVHARLQAEGAFRKERMEKLIAKYEKQEAEDFKKLSFKPDITPHPIHSGDQYNNSTITPFDRMYEDFKQREAKLETTLIKAGKPSPRKTIKDNQPIPTLPRDQAVEYARDFLAHINTNWVLQNLSEIDDIARQLFDRAHEDGHLPLHTTRQLLDIVVDTFGLTLDDREFLMWFFASKNAEDVIDRKPFVFLVRTLLRTRIVQPPNQPFQARPSPRAMQTPTKALSPFQSSRVCAMPNKAPEHATVMWLAVAPGLTVSMNPASSSYTITNLKMIRGFQWVDSITGVASPPAPLEPNSPLFLDLPPGAAYYCFVYPPVHACPMAQSLKRRKDPRMAFLSYGGFLLLSRDLTVLTALGLSPTKHMKDSYRIYFGPCDVLPKEAAETIMHELRPTTFAPYTQVPDWDENAPSSAEQQLRVGWLRPDTYFPMSKFKWPKLPHGALVYVAPDGTASYAPLMCYNQKVSGGRWETAQGTCQAITLPLVMQDVVAHIIQWADIPSMTHDAKAFSFYCHALFRNSLSDVDGALERGRFAAIMRSVHAVCGLKEDFNAVLKQAQSKMAELPNTDSPFVSEMEFIVVMRHFLDCKEEIIQEQLSGIDGDEVEAEPLPPNGMSSVWVLPEVFDLDIEVKPTERTYVLKHLDPTNETWDWHLQGHISDVQLTEASGMSPQDGSEEATIFAFAAPIPHLQQVLDVSKPSHAFLAYGGFLYMTNDYKVVQVKALSGRKTSSNATQLIFSQPITCSLPLRSFPARRLHPTSLPLPLATPEPFTHRAWLLPGEGLPLPVPIPHGAFFYSDAPPFTLSERADITGRLWVMVCGHTRCCGKYWLPSVSTMVKELNAKVAQNEIELLLKCHDIYDRIKDEADNNAMDCISAESFKPAHSALIDHLGLPQNCKDSSELWCEVTNPDGTRWISEEGFSTAVQSLLQFQAQLADKDPSAVQTQAEVIRELQEACHKHVLEAGVLRMSPHITMSLVVDLRMQCYSVRDPDLLKMGLGNLTGSLSALCQVTESAKQALRRSGVPDVQYYAFAYPTPNIEALIEDVTEPRQEFLAMGGFVYLDAQCNVVHVDCLKSAEEEEPNSQQLSVSDVEMLPLESVSKLLMQNRWQLCKPAEENKKAQYFAWLLPGEYLVKPSLIHGALAYAWLDPSQMETLKTERGRQENLSMTLSLSLYDDEPHAVVCRVVCTNHRCCGDFWRESHGLQSHAPGLKSSTPLNAGRPGLSPAPRSVGGTPASLTASPLVNLLPHNPKLPSGAPAHPTAPRRTASADLSGNVNGNVEAAARI